jgi:hypothetical protein
MSRQAWHCLLGRGFRGRSSVNGAIHSMTYGTYTVTQTVWNTLRLSFIWK